MAGLTDPIIRLTGGNPDAPSPGIVPLDPGTQGMINAGVDRAGRSASDFTADMNQGASQNAGSIGQDPQHTMQSEIQAGGDPQHMSEALRQAYASQSGTSVGRLMKANDYRGTLAKADYMNKMSQTMIAQQRVAAQNNATLVDAYNANENARAGFINSLFQIGQQGMAIAAANHRRSAKPKSPAAPNVGGSGVGNEMSGSGGMGEPMPSFGSDGGME